MSPDPSRTDERLELGGAESELAVNDDLPIPDGEQDRAREHIREYVEREREWLDKQPRFEPDVELIKEREQFREQVAERIAEELGLLEEYEALRNREQGQASERSDPGARDVDGTEGGNE